MMINKKNEKININDIYNRIKILTGPKHMHVVFIHKLNKFKIIIIIIILLTLLSPNKKSR
jgi:hypothetical protein